MKIKKFKNIKRYIWYTGSFYDSTQNDKIISLNSKHKFFVFLLNLFATKDSLLVNIILYLLLLVTIGQILIKFDKFTIFIVFSVIHFFSIIIFQTIRILFIENIYDTNKLSKSANTELEYTSLQETNK